jgi:large subunit ribosomal protein L30
MALIKITQHKSKIRCLEKHKRTLAALGLRRIRHSVVKEDTPQIRGMIAAVSYLVHVEPASAGAATAKAPARAAKAPKPATAPKAAAAPKAPRAPKAKAPAKAKPAAKGGAE